MVRSTWSSLTTSYSPDDLALLTAYRSLVGSLDGVSERIHTKEIDFALKRVFTSAYVKSHWLEVGIDLTRQLSGVDHLRTSFASTKTVFTHRFTLSSASQLGALRPLLVEARDTVGPGFR